MQTRSNSNGNIGDCVTANCMYISLLAKNKKKEKKSMQLAELANFKLKQSAQENR